MIVLDTNVVSELMRAAPDPDVVGWVDRWPPGELHLTSMTAAELLHGVARLPPGGRRELLAEKVRILLGDLFDGRILAFTVPAAVHYGRIASARDRAGTPISTADAVIAATTAAAGADALATRNVRDFVATGLTVVNPWGG